ncbi:MAG: sigma-70 family RNA polymerase sigma factor [Candidatus Limnocylindrus sp.]
MNSDSITRSFLNDLGRYPLLTPEQEVMLARKVQVAKELELKEQAGEVLTPAERRTLRNGKKAKDRLVNCNLRLVVMIAKKYTNRVTHLSLLDLVQEGCFGLIRGAELYDPARGYKFSTYAYWWIRQGISRGLSQQEHLIRPPHHIAEKMSKIRATMTRLAQNNKEMPSLSALALEMDMDQKELELLLTRTQRLSSLDAPVGGDADLSNVGDLVPDPASVDGGPDYNIDDFLRLKSSMSMLDERERQVLIMRHGLEDYHPMSYIDIGKAIGISRERVRQLEFRALRKVRMYMKQINPLSKAHFRRDLPGHSHEAVDLVWSSSGPQYQHHL